MGTPVMPNAGIAKRTMHFIWLVDCSSSMEGRKISMLNEAIKNALPATRDAASENPHVEIKMRVIKFADKAEWLIKTPTPLDDFEWTDLTTSGLTAMGAALDLLSESLTIESLGARNLRPVFVLITDGYATDDFKGAISRLLANPWGKKAVKIGIGIGASQSDFDYTNLERFIDNSEIPVLNSRNPEELKKYIQWASTYVTSIVSGAKSNLSSSSNNIVIGQLPEALEDDELDDVF